MRLFITCIFLFIGECCSFSSHAQNTWVWGRGNTCSGMDGWAVATDHVGNVYEAGINFGGLPAVFGTYRVPNAGSGLYQTIVAKYDGNGNFQWARGTQNGNTYLMNIATDQNNNLLVFGTFSSPSVQIGTFTLTKPPGTDPQYFLAKYDPSGNVLWVKGEGNAQGNYVFAGGIAAVLGSGNVATDATGNIYITANYHLASITIGANTLTNTDATGTTNDIFIAKYDPTGSVIWAKTYGGSKDDDAYGLTVTPAGDIYIAGDFASHTIAFSPSVTITNATTGAEAYIARFDAFGNATWASSSAGGGGEYAVGLASDDQNNVYLTGGLKDNSMAFGTTVITNPDPPRPVLYLVKFDPGNNVSWFKTIKSVDGHGAWGYAISMSKCGSVWVTGVMSNIINIDDHILYAPPNSCDPIFIAGYSKQGVYVGSAALQSGGDDQTGIACDDKGNVYLCSDFACVPFVIAKDTFRTTYENDSVNDCYGGGELMYVAKYATVTVDSEEIKITKINVCPGSPLMLEAPDGYQNYIWNDGTVSSSFKITDTGTYWVYGTLDCSFSLIDTFKIGYACDCEKALFLPNSFTPNGDGQNDVYYPRSGKGIKKIKSFRIYNRWGELLFEKDDILANDANSAWDGSYKGEAPLPDVYVWVVEAVCENDMPLNKKGSVTIIR